MESCTFGCFDLALLPPLFRHSWDFLNGKKCCIGVDIKFESVVKKMSRSRSNRFMSVV